MFFENLVANVRQKAVGKVLLGYHYLTLLVNYYVKTGLGGQHQTVDEFPRRAPFGNYHLTANYICIVMTCDTFVT